MRAQGWLTSRTNQADMAVSDDGCASHPGDKLVERTKFPMLPFGRVAKRGFCTREVEQVGLETHDLLGLPKLAATQPAFGRRIDAHARSVPLGRSAVNARLTAGMSGSTAAERVPYRHLLVERHFGPIRTVSEGR